MKKEEALELIKYYKDLLDLEVISEDEYNKYIKEYKPFISIEKIKNEVYNEIESSKQSEKSTDKSSSLEHKKTTQYTSNHSNNTTNKKKSPNWKLKLVILFICLCGITVVIKEFIGPSACDCANLYENSPMKKNYSYGQLNDGHTLRNDADKHVKKAKACAIKYGNLTDFEKKLTKDIREMNMIPNLYESIRNAKKECAVNSNYSKSDQEMACNCWNQSVKKTGKAFDNMTKSEQNFRMKCFEKFSVEDAMEEICLESFDSKTEKTETNFDKNISNSENKISFDEEFNDERNGKQEKSEFQINSLDNKDITKDYISAKIIIGSFGAESNAEKLKKSLLIEGFEDIDISKVGNVNRVSIFVSGSKEEAKEVLKRVKVYHKSAWISYN